MLAARSSFTLKVWNLSTDRRKELILASYQLSRKLTLLQHRGPISVLSLLSLCHRPKLLWPYLSEHYRLGSKGFWSGQEKGSKGTRLRAHLITYHRYVDALILMTHSVPSSSTTMLWRTRAWHPLKRRRRRRTTACNSLPHLLAETWGRSGTEARTYRRRRDTRSLPTPARR